LHFCSQDYLPHFGNGYDSRVVIVKINPADVVSIPSDYNNAKGRACRYEVVGEIGNDGDKIDNAFNKPVQANASNNIAKPVVKAAPVVTGPKQGSTEFYRGYTDGYEGKEFSPSTRSNPDYEEGFEKGDNDSELGLSPRYQYVTKQAAPKASGVWPFPNGGYDPSI
jgi:hypothetical protein